MPCIRSSQLACTLQALLRAAVQHIDLCLTCIYPAVKATACECDAVGPCCFLHILEVGIPEVRAGWSEVLTRCSVIS